MLFYIFIIKIKFRDYFMNLLVGHENLNNVLVLHVILMAEESIIVSRRSHARIVGPRQWHVTRGGHIVEKEF